MYRWLAFAVVGLALLATAFWTLNRGGSGGGKRAVARAEERDGILVIRLSGPPLAKGRALGEALRERVRDELEAALPEPAVRDFAVTTCGQQLGAFLPDAYREEIAGIAEGAGISFEEALFLDARYEIAAFGFARGCVLPEEGAAGPGPEAACILPEGSEGDLVVVIHEDLDPPLVLLARPGMAGGFLGISGNVAAAMRPIRGDAPPTLKGLVWTLLLRRLLEAPPSGRFEAPSAMTGPLSVAMSLPDGTAGTLNLAVFGASWYEAGGEMSLTTDEPPKGREGGTVPRLSRDPADRARVAEAAARLLGGDPPKGRTVVKLRGGERPCLVVAGPSGSRTVPLGRP